MNTNDEPFQIPAFDRAMRAILNVTKSEVDAMRPKELKRKPQASTRKRKGK